MTTPTRTLAPGIESRLAIVPAARPLVLAGLAMLAMVPFTLVALWLDPRTLDPYLAAQSVWLKPLKFQVATGLHTLTVALFLSALTPQRQADRTTRILVWVMVVSGLYEVLYITLRGAQGLPSHFATDPFGAVMFQLMGVLAAAIVVVTAIFGIRVLRGDPGAMSRHLHLALGLGLLVAGVGGLVSGATIGVLGGPILGAAEGASVPVFGWSGVGGDLRVSHFFGIHALQALPLAALAIGARGAREGRLAVWTVTAAWSALIVFVYLQALAERPFVAL